MDERHVISAPGIEVTIAAQGAEPVSLRDTSEDGGGERLWQAGPAWPRHAPLLFPIVGRLKGDMLRHDGHEYRLTQHGFARDRRFAWTGRDDASCQLRLEDDEASRAIYPFPFRLDVHYAVADRRLDVTYEVSNTGASMLPASIGAHPGFAWPLREGVPHRLVFDADEPAPIRRVAGGLLRDATEPSPIDGRILALSPSLFTDDAVILDAPASRSVRYEAEGGPALTVGWDGFVQLGVWSKPGAPLLCIEPWFGLASPEGFDGAFSDKPWLMHLAPGETRRFGWFVTLDVATDGPAPR